GRAPSSSKIAGHALRAVSIGIAAAESVRIAGGELDAQRAPDAARALRIGVAPARKRTVGRERVAMWPARARAAIGVGCTTANVILTMWTQGRSGTIGFDVARSARALGNGAGGIVGVGAIVVGQATHARSRRRIASRRRRSGAIGVEAAATNHRLKRACRA